ncbi:MAG: hypothetical protein LBI92_06845 [Azoarcus sp.]|jgi:hypothetical protein|nr:hypothetical protein [Azoarcus sp.]
MISVVDSPSLSRETFPPPPEFFPSPDWTGLLFVDSPARVGVRGYRGKGCIYGVTAPGVLVRCYGYVSGELMEQVMSDAEGRYRIGNLVPGRPYDLRYGHIVGNNDVVHTGVAAGVWA